MLSGGRDRPGPVYIWKRLNLAPCVIGFHNVVFVAIVQDRTQQRPASISRIARSAEQVRIIGWSLTLSSVTAKGDLIVAPFLQLVRGQLRNFRGTKHRLYKSRPDGTLPSINRSGARGAVVFPCSRNRVLARHSDCRSSVFSACFCASSNASTVSPSAGARSSASPSLRRTYRPPRNSSQRPASAHARWTAKPTCSY